MTWTRPRFDHPSVRVVPLTAQVLPDIAEPPTVPSRACAARARSADGDSLP